uniref:Uncharacterized protein n=1 Tax=Meloidogyne floridensis TaxID=298350 RepID=A0A915P7Z5_9BILA
RKLLFDKTTKLQFQKNDYTIIILKIDGLKVIGRHAISNQQIPNWSEYALLILRPIKILKFIAKQKRMKNIKMFVGCGNDGENKYLFELDQKTEEGYYSSNYYRMQICKNDQYKLIYVKEKKFGIVQLMCNTAIHEGEMENVYIFEFTGYCQLEFKENKLITQENIKENILTEKQMGIYNYLIRIQNAKPKEEGVESSKQALSSQQTTQESTQQTSQHPTQHSPEHSSKNLPKHSPEHSPSSKHSPKDSAGQQASKTNIPLREVQQHSKQAKQIIHQINPTTLTPQQNKIQPHMSRLIKEVSDFHKKQPQTLQAKSKTSDKHDHPSPSSSSSSAIYDPFKYLPMEKKSKILSHFYKNLKPKIEKPKNIQFNFPILNEITMRRRNELNFSERMVNERKIKLSSSIQLTEEEFEEKMKVKKSDEEIGEEGSDESMEEDEEINFDEEELEEKEIIDEFAYEACRNESWDNLSLWEDLLEEYSEIEKNLNLREEMKGENIYLPKGKSRFFKDNSSSSSTQP